MQDVDNVANYIFSNKQDIDKDFETTSRFEEL